MIAPASIVNFLRWALVSIAFVAVAQANFYRLQLAAEGRVDDRAIEDDVGFLQNNQTGVASCE
ncbi:MAG: hypothetical protein QOG55_269 [Acidobacteriaceae bacterium]|jgi:hypothetical protein|nr:hypothetical protein [Acidobacteriaceae bacterium]